MWLDILFGIFTPLLACELYVLFYFLDLDREAQQYATVQMRKAFIHRDIHTVDNN